MLVLLGNIPIALSRVAKENCFPSSSYKSKAPMVMPYHQLPLALSFSLSALPDDTQTVLFSDEPTRAPRLSQSGRQHIPNLSIGATRREESAGGLGVLL